MPRDYQLEIKRHLDEIEKLISTPNLLINMVIQSLKGIDFAKLDYGSRRKIQNLLDSFKNIENLSIRRAFTAIYNQACVLAVSALSVTIENYFSNYATSQWKEVKFPNNIKLSLEKMAEYDFNLKVVLGKIILKEDNSINFQDLQSTIRTFKQYLGKNIKVNDKTEKEIIFYQQCRHVILHKAGIIDKKFLERVDKKQANLKNYKEGDKIELNLEDWNKIKESFRKLIHNIVPTKTKDI